VLLITVSRHLSFDSIRLGQAIDALVG